MVRIPESGTPTAEVVRAVIFDRDGVLTEFDYAGLAAAMQPLVSLPFATLGALWTEWQGIREFPDVAAEPTYGVEFWGWLAPRIALPDERRTQLAAIHLNAFIHIYPDVRPALQAAHAAGLRVGVLSNFGIGLAESLAALADLIDAQVVARRSGTYKLQPTPYFAVAAALGVTPAQCLYFDDKPACVAGAAAVRMRGYLVDRTRSEQAIRQHVLADLSCFAQVLLGESPPPVP